MLKSMTGFASLGREHDMATIAVTVPSVNNRFLDLQLRLPSTLAPLEQDLRVIAQRHAARGRVEITVSLQLKQTSLTDVEINEPLVSALAAAVDRLREQAGLAGALTVADVLRLPQAVSVKERAVDAESWAGVCREVSAAVEAAMSDLDRMRVREGEYLRADLDTRCDALKTLVDRIDAAAQTGREMFVTRVMERVADLAPDVQTDPGAVAQEVARLAARSDISEEVARLRGHFEHWTVLANGSEPCGRTLDFLLQEMNREINTIGSKAEGLTVPELIVTAKSELEKLREQTQNVE